MHHFCQYITALPHNHLNKILWKKQLQHPQIGRTITDGLYRLFLEAIDEQVIKVTPVALFIETVG